MSPTLCVITPTLKRPTLWRALDSARLGPDDKWIIMIDGGYDIEIALRLSRLMANRADYIQHWADTTPGAGFRGDYGNPLRDIAMSWSTQDYLLFLDDDDIFTPGAIDIVKRETSQRWPKPVIFKMRNGNGEILWKTKDLTPGNVGGSMFCCPNIPGKLGQWANGHGHRSDFEFIRQTLELQYGDDWRRCIYWSDKVIVECKPEAITE